MVGTPLEIPGFYYDSARNRYFRIASQGISTPSAHDYTREHLNQYNSRKRTSSKDDEKQSTTKKHHRNLLPSLNKYLFSRQLAGTFGNFMNAGLLGRRGREITFSPSLQGITLQKIHWVPGLNKYIFSSSRGDMFISSLYSANDSNLHDLKVSPNNGMVPQKVNVARLGLSPSSITSISSNLGTGLFWTTLSSQSTESKAHMCSYNISQDSPENYTQISLRSMKTPHCSEFIKGVGFAVGGSNKIALLNEEGVFQRNLHSKGDVFTLTAVDQNILAAGCRNKSVLLYDLRAPSKNICRFAHDASVCSTSLVDSAEPKLLVSGLVSSISLYDLRFVRHTSKVSHLMSYSGHSNMVERNLAFMCNEKGTLFGAAGDDSHIRFWNIDSPEIVADFQTDTTGTNILHPDGTWMKSKDTEGWLLLVNDRVHFYES
ncbi:WD repeat protein, DDB1 and CUL4-associated factor 4-like protein Wdr21-like [Schizosaccharomyces osmophilus]|uniref:WD repeat protein, DDB1 and CUL4-associated factor 4-like protein Wdr21-like n=1 Tax=Schizosaccharomyces osmophilus TaxID=2545709 RepID=A0AAE9WBY9_9SCHI|nr:WD repeat protein, DDB1 and CUL4-associated factor 4-like protein Wdr21-like [Schizosaccharomyces osmophilus]WBW73410.1 WD repeat protein, DDB1 and CUL4-associated factor 4-like protein Wdr21-like [Schizosaccharomyces osmophilus]